MTVINTEFISQLLWPKYMVVKINSRSTDNVYVLVATAHQKAVRKPLRKFPTPNLLSLYFLKKMFSAMFIVGIRQVSLNSLKYFTQLMRSTTKLS